MARFSFYRPLIPAERFRIARTQCFISRDHEHPKSGEMLENAAIPERSENSDPKYRYAGLVGVAWVGSAISNAAVSALQDPNTLSAVVAYFWITAMILIGGGFLSWALWRSVKIHAGKASRWLAFFVGACVGMLIVVAVVQGALSRYHNQSSLGGWAIFWAIIGVAGNVVYLVLSL